MYRIQKAVIKAKGEHKPFVPEKEPVISPLEALKYSKTRVVNTHPDMLEDLRLIAGHNNNVNSQIFRSLRTQVIQKMREGKWASLAITSPNAGEGKTLIAANLAAAIAMEVNQTVLLVDLDLKTPSVSQYFNIEPEFGMLDYLLGQVSLDKVMVNPGVERLVVVPGRGKIVNSSELISSPKMVSFFAETKNRYSSRIVIYDMPPILPSDDVLSSIGNVDCALLVLEDGKNTEKDIVRSIRQLRNTAMLGTVVNKFHKGSWVL